MKKKSLRTLHLHRETLVKLESKELERAIGAGTTKEETCDTCRCDPDPNGFANNPTNP